VVVCLRAAQDDVAAWARIDIHDNGSGITGANAPRIFEPFFTTARNRGSTGLGLSIVRSLLAAHGGEIRLLPAERGAHFRLRLPLAASPSPS
jgi:signal transduction histidine kinase